MLLVDRPAHGALIAGITILGMLAVDRSCQNLGHGSLARAPGPAKKIGMPHPVHLHLVFQCGDNMILSAHIIKSDRPPFPVECLISHLPASFLLVYCHEDTYILYYLKSV